MLWKVVFIFTFMIYLHCFNASKLNVPKLLLPYYSQAPTNFTLEASEGCFTWKSTRPEIALVEPVGADQSSCSRSAVVIAVSRIPTRKTAIIMAEDSVTGQPLRCDVIVDEIVKIEIETTTKELFLDDSPEEFVLRAVNDKEDVFSSLSGLTFDWNLMPDTDSGAQPVTSAHNVLRILKFSESSYTAPQYIKTWEEQGKRGDHVLMRGLHTGAAIITVKPSDPVYKHVAESRVRIFVVANLQLVPSTAYILQHATVTYTVELLKHGRVHVVKMPSPQYYIELDNSTVASFDTASSTAEGLMVGCTELKLKGHNLQLSETVREPSAGLYVVVPSYLEFMVTPGRSWMLQTSHIYYIHVEIFDKESRKIYPSENLRVKVDFPEKYFQVMFSSQNGTYHVVNTVCKGFTNLYGELKAIMLTNGAEFPITPPVEGTQPVEIFEPVVLLPKELYVPWDPTKKSIQYQMTVSGGSGNYTWRSSNTSLARVNAWGLVTTGFDVGKLEITASDIRNPSLFDNSTIYVFPPSRVEFVESRVEAEVGTTLRLPVAVYGRIDRAELKYNVCHSILFAVDLSDASVFQYSSLEAPTVEGSCADLLLTARSAGHSKVTISYVHELFELRAALTVAAYRLLKAYDPAEVAVVTLGSSKEVIFEGGPLPWILDSSRYSQSAKSGGENGVRISKVSMLDSSRQQHSFWVECLALGEETLTLMVGNKPTAKNKFPATSQATVRFACEEPVGLSVVPLLTYPEGLPPCPISAEVDDPVPVPLVEHATLSVSMFDRLGRKFDNFSSIFVDWKSSDVSLGTLRRVLDSSDEELRQRTAYHQYVRVLLKGQTGHLSVTTSVDRYSHSHVENLPTKPSLPSEISRTRILDLIKYPSFLQSHMSIYNHPKNKALMQIAGGSGHFHLSRDPPPPYTANVTYTTKQPRQISIIPLREGSLQLTVTDLCLPALSSATSSVIISDIGSIVVDVVDKVQQNHEISAHVQVLDYGQRPILSDHFALMDLRLVAGSDIISIRRSENVKAGDEYTAVYVICGLSLGRTDVVATAVQHGKKNLVTSDAREIQVFPPLQLDPHNITVIPGTLFQVLASGGPQPESTIEFRHENATIGVISQNGVIEARAVGQTMISARAVGFDTHSRHVVYSQDSAVLNVIDLTMVKIAAPLKRLQTKTQMPLYAAGVGETLTPFSLAGIIPPLTFLWSISNRQIAQLKSAFYTSGLEAPEKGSVAMRLLAEEAGQVIVTLNVTWLHNGVERVLTDSMTVQIFEGLRLTTPAVAYEAILLTPNILTEIHTNRDGSSAQITYTVTDCDASSRPQRELPVEVSRGGLLTTSTYSGQACLLVSSVEDFGVNQSTVVHIKVKPVSYLMIKSETVLHSVPGLRMTAFPTAMTIRFTVSFHDDVGVEFYATSSRVRFRLHKYDQLQLSHGQHNASFVARATNAGLTVLKVWDELNPSISDYVAVEVGSSIQPYAAVVALGSVVCFTSPLISADGRHGEWLTQSTAILINRQSGIARAVHAGTSVVKYNVSSDSITQTDVKIVPVTAVQLDAGKVEFVTNVQVTKARSQPVIRVVMSNGPLVAELHGSNCSEHVRAEMYNVDHVPFRCEMELTPSSHDLTVNDLFHVKSAFDPVSGEYQCVIESVASSDNTLTISTVTGTIQVRATVLEAVGQYEISSTYVGIPFLPAFHIMTSELHISGLHPQTILKVSASDRVIQELQVTSDDPSLLIVREPRRKSVSEQNIVHYPVELQVAASVWKGAPPFINVEVKCPTTGQAHMVPVRIQRGDQTELTWVQLVGLLLSNYYSFFFLLLTILAAVCCCLVAYNMLRGPRYPPSTVVLSPPQPGQPQYIQTPPWSSTPVYASGSPQKNILWSVDRSPYSNVTQRSPHNVTH